MATFLLLTATPVPVTTTSPIDLASIESCAFTWLSLPMFSSFVSYPTALITKILLAGAASLNVPSEDALVPPY